MTHNRRIVVFTTLLGTVILGLLVGIMWLWLNQPVMNMVRLGAPFTLIDGRGEPITEKALEGHPSLLYFGFTRCPEVCPTTLYEMAGWFKTLGAEADPLKAFFFSVDPERDSPELMHSYTSAFTDRITGITGSPDEMQKVIRGLRVYAAKVPTGDGDYTMDHTASVFLVGADGALKGTIAYGEEASLVVSRIQKLLREP